MFARTALVLTAAERVARYYEGIYEGGSLYIAADRHDGSVPDPLHHTTAGSIHTEGSDPEFGGGSPLRHRLDTEGSDPEFFGGSPLRQTQDRLERKIQDVMDAVAALREDLRKSDEERDRQHREGNGAGDTVREQQMQVPGGTDTGVFEETVTQALLEFSLLMEVQHVDSPVHIQDHTTDLSSPLGQSPCSRPVHTHGLTRRSIQRTPAPKRPRTLPLSSAHTFRPNDLVDAYQLAAYQAYKRIVIGELLLLVGNQPWHEVDAVLIPCNIGGQHWLVASVDLTVGKIHLLDPFRQEVPLQIRKEQVAPLQWFLPSMLHQVGFHDARPTGEVKYEKQNMPFGVLAKRVTFDWSEDDMGTIREKMAVEIFCNSKLHYML
ncbi:hypothetical protein Dsin_017271 [Dipteronia sinensis]|uniref:Ubiquitin-like protease family profile domain-containing protein n=1 Tax=Dipteronia sinensis TaxID=43782 RepID=A0AAE0AEQ1_9ROSI|nr:hypothetical protein Dsin_017271 [Dipteronia sinensis]